MKKLFTILATVLLTSLVFAQSPNKMSYQAIVRNANGELIKSSNVGIRISILQGSISGNIVYQEVQTTLSNINGLITLEIGDGSVVVGTFANIDWANGSYFIQTEIDPAGSTNYTVSSVNQLLTVPYAFYAKSSGNGFSGNYNDLTNKPNLPDSFNFLKTESDPIFNASVAKGINSSDTIKWNTNYVKTETDPVFSASVAKGINSNDITKWNATSNILNSGGYDSILFKIADKRFSLKIDSGGNLKVTRLPNIEQQSTALKDIEGNIYKIDTIGTQIWMAENLKTTTFSDGSAIPNITDGTSWANSTNSGYCWNYNDSASYKSNFGALYNWYAVNTGNLCPTGWYVPNDTDWMTLVNYLGGGSVAGGKLKSTGTTLWNSPNAGADNSTGFSAHPGGYRDFAGTFASLGNFSIWWSSHEVNASQALDWNISYAHEYITSYNHNKTYGFNIRCLKGK